MNAGRRRGAVERMPAGTQVIGQPVKNSPHEETPGGAGSTPGRTAVATLAGTTLEWYDFFLYGTAAALIFNKQFFPR